ncbi:hypothetical protein JTE90_015637 [Oedothorax gibbosus]|uniref:Uncharacterized protein n=1 Tax=Oedothorax gibbosus TaxID=931172 RepID=A0AAV6USG6_9ARAC|nr:hypothetical protein JTE90_015637 [Oedothorax gibbosus]
MLRVFETRSMDLSSAFKILGKGGGEGWNWDFNSKSLAAKNNSSTCVLSANDFLKKPWNVLLGLCVLLLLGPGLVNCGE